ARREQTRPDGAEDFSVGIRARLAVVPEGSLVGHDADQRVASDAAETARLNRDGDAVREFDLLPRRLAFDLLSEFRMVLDVAEQDARLLLAGRDARDDGLLAGSQFEAERPECVIGDDASSRNVLAASSADAKIGFLDRHSRSRGALRELLEDRLL